MLKIYIQIESVSYRNKEGGMEKTTFYRKNKIRERVSRTNDGVTNL
ncbi:MAG: hypothetical protein ACTSQE_11515 [Candidatus Heimdallarchaeaceae archaeon]